MCALGYKGRWSGTEGCWGLRKAEVMRFFVDDMLVYKWHSNPKQQGRIKDGHLRAFLHCDTRYLALR